ncbi:hypothetical protein TCE0_018r05260 [Talaromyces pinophilus]|uniref:PA14 domain-containing protein n=1 Tax=Talaromyces pinophilus TaxID=128442 RepID=A0A510NVP8_TALPI|nr:hypothetical protein TCE0_018r05260 [Talaromyces pinophilus]
MKLTLYLGLVALSTAVALPLDPTPSDCSCLADAVSVLSADPLAPAFCSKFVGVSTVVVSTTITTPAATTVIVETVPAPFTITDTFVDFESTSTTITETYEISYVSTSTVTVTSPTTECYSGTTFGNAASPASATAAAGNVVKKALLPTITLPTISLPTFPVPIPTPTWVPSLQDSLLSSAFITLVTTSTAFVVTTESIATSTVTTTTTSYTPVPTNTQLGLNWYYYYSSQNYFPGHAITFNPQTFNSPNYNFSGYVENVASFRTVAYSTSSSNTVCSLPANEPCAFVCIVIQGYLWAKNGPGNYTLSSSTATDNAFFAWHGTKAYSDYQNSNYDYLAGDYIPQAGSVTVSVGIGELVPFTFMWANGGGPGEALLTITDPSGKQYADTTGFFVPANSTCPGYVDPFSP